MKKWKNFWYYKIHVSAQSSVFSYHIFCHTTLSQKFLLCSSSRLWMCCLWRKPLQTEDWLTSSCPSLSAIFKWFMLYKKSSIQIATKSIEQTIKIVRRAVYLFFFCYKQSDMWLKIVYLCVYQTETFKILWDLSADTDCTEPFRNNPGNSQEWSGQCVCLLEHLHVRLSLHLNQSLCRIGNVTLLELCLILMHENINMVWNVTLSRCLLGLKWNMTISWEQVQTSQNEQNCFPQKRSHNAAV